MGSVETFVVWNLYPKGFQFSSISGFFLKNFCGLEILIFQVFRFQNFRFSNCQRICQFGIFKMSELSALKMSKNLPIWNFQNVRILCFKNVQEFANLVFSKCQIYLL